MKSNYEDQATRLRNQMEQIQQESTKVQDYQKELTPEISIDPKSTTDADILNLPPRSHVHDDKNKKTKWKISFLFVRFLLVLFLIIVTLILTYNNWWGEDLLQSAEKNSDYSHPAGEEVNIVPLNMRFSDEVTIQVQIDDVVTDLTGKYYTVGEGDTLSSIAEDYYGTTYLSRYLRNINQLETITLHKDQQIFLPNIKKQNDID